MRKYSPSIRIQNANPAKIYCIDTGLRTATGFYTSGDLRRTAENLVLIKLQKLKNFDPILDFYYWKGKKRNSEVDFVIKRGKKIVQLIQVTWIIDDETTKMRETKGLLDAMTEFGLRSGLEFWLLTSSGITLLGLSKILLGWPYTILILVLSYLYGIWRLGTLKGPSVDEFITGDGPPWKGQKRGF